MTYSASGACVTTVSRQGMLRSSSIDPRIARAADRVADELAARAANAAAPASSRSRMPVASATASAKRASSSAGSRSSSHTGFMAAITPLTDIGRMSSTSACEIVWPVSLASMPCTRRSSIAAAASSPPASPAPNARQTSPKLA